MYVDDILVIRNNDGAISKLISDLHTQFSLKQLGDLHYFLGVEAFRDSTALYMSQSNYLVDLLTRFNMGSIKPYNSPLTHSQMLSKLEGEAFEDPTLYKRVIRALHDITLTRPDISYIVNKLSQFLQYHTTIQWLVCKRVLRCLKHTVTRGLSFKSTPQLSLTCFADAE